ncbi:hypothetical protein [Agromyces humi]|uniref:hypothetical protein n=1 Tax=Agromyces humi TaxID=1766800 RepID=UPI001359FD25|nr:hypothetical protein [Agromyces humi]
MTDTKTETRLERYERLAEEERARLRAEEERKAAKLRARDLKEFELLDGGEDVQGSAANARLQLKKWQARIDERVARMDELSAKHGFTQ